MALRATELRVGNLVYFRNESYKVVLIANDLIKIDIGFGAVQRFEKNPIYSPRLDELKPIPLTEEWLLKFEFERFAGQISYDKKKLSIYLGDTIICGKEGRTYYNSWCILEYSPKYVHQLQNLYFALTGEELIYKQAEHITTKDLQDIDEANDEKE